MSSCRLQSPRVAAFMGQSLYTHNLGVSTLFFSWDCNSLPCFDSLAVYFLFYCLFGFAEPSLFPLENRRPCNYLVRFRKRLLCTISQRWIQTIEQWQQNAVPHLLIHLRRSFEIQIVIFKQNHIIMHYYEWNILLIQLF